MTTPLQLSANIISRFNDKIHPEPNSGCWLWGASIDKHGYGRLTIGKTAYLAHRLSFCIATGEMPKPYELICHSCDNRPCVNPSHLFIGSPSDNMRDAVAKGRLTNRGSNNNRSILDEEKALCIFNDKRGYNDLSLEFGVSVSTIHSIKSGNNWRHATSNKMGAE